MKAQDLQDHLRTLNGGWMNLENTVDTFKAGDPDDEIRGVAVGWMSYRWALERALELGCNVFITHEPTYFDHRDKDEKYFALAGAAGKKKFIEDNRLVIIRCHDLWDQMPEIGIPDSWAAHLGLSGPLVTDGYFRVYDVGGKSAREVASHVAGRVAQFGQENAQLFGPADKQVSRLALGTGAITPFFRFVQHYQADIGLCTDDGVSCWQSGALAIDCGIPMVTVNHAVSEEPGIINLAGHLKAKFRDIPVHHIPQRCMYELVSS